MDIPTETIYHLGPYDIHEVTKPMLSDLVIRQGVPIILKQDIMDGDGVKVSTRYAVLATKDLKVVCAQCFGKDTLLTNKQYCKACSTFVKHWDQKDGLRIQKCKKESMIETMKAICTRVQLVPGLDKSLDLKRASNDELLAEIEKRGLSASTHKQQHYEEEGFTDLTNPFLIGARPVDLIHELRRQSEDDVVSDTIYYGNEKPEDGRPYKTDEVGGELYVVRHPITKNGRVNKRKKPITDRVAILDPKAFTDKA